MGKLVTKDQGGSGISRRWDTPTPSHRLCLVNAQSKSFLIPEELGLMRGFGLSHCFQLQTGQGHPEVGSGTEFKQIHASLEQASPVQQQQSFLTAGLPLACPGVPRGHGCIKEHPDVSQDVSFGKQVRRTAYEGHCCVHLFPQPQG